MMDTAKKNTILIADDENANIMALTHILSKDYTIFAVKNGQKAMEAAEKYLPDLIMLDIVMPEMDGYAVIAALKGAGKTHHIPIIFITGLSSPVDEEKGLSLGAADYISKPFSPAIVKLRVQNQIKMIQQTRLIIEKEINEKSSRTRSEFLSRMSHEMHTPMNAIMGLTILAKNTVESEKRNDMLEKINSASVQLLRLIDDVLDVSDIEDNKLLLSCSTFNFAAMMQDIADRANPGMMKKRQSLATQIDPAIPDALLGDERRLAQAIWHLLSNAVEYTPEQGFIQIRASVLDKEEETITIQIDVSDNGAGISEEQCQKLFIPFEQGDGGISRRHGGAGLGLPLAKHIIGLMGGTIQVESECGKGSTFTVIIKPQLAVLEEKGVSPVPLAGKRILLAEDVEINREIVMGMLEDTGLQIICVENGLEALESFTSSPEKYDAILMDINMPEMDGLEATRRIRALETPEGRLTPIIALTANVLHSDVETYIAGGMTDHLSKPLDNDQLLQKLYKHMNTA